MMYRQQRKFSKNKNQNAAGCLNPWKKWLKHYGNRAYRAYIRDNIYINDPERTNDALSRSTKKDASNPWDWY